MKDPPGGSSPEAWLFQNPRWPPRGPENLKGTITIELFVLES